MAINPIQQNIDVKSPQKSFRDADGAVDTSGYTRPLPPQGHLVHDRLISMPKFFFKDIMYDLKAVKDGFTGKANDHQTGRLNDVGLRLGGIGIATMLAARTASPMGRLMEYLGLGTFLASMSIFPKLFIQAPAAARFGFDTGLEYIDDQGRKKSVFQDSNYIPFDMYTGEHPMEDLDIIGDRLGIPREAKNRHDIVREQMRKIATQNNTLWMLTAGFATPVMTSLACCGLEKLIAPAVEKGRNLNCNSQISHMLKHTGDMSIAVEDIKSNSLSKSVEKLLACCKNKELAQSDFNNLVKLLTENLDANVSEGIKADLDIIFKPESRAEANKAEDVINSIKSNITSRNREKLEKVFVPSKEELADILNNDDIYAVKDGLKKLFNKKIEKETGMSKEFLKAYRNELIEKVSKTLQNNKRRYVDDKNLKEVVNLAKILGEFKKNDKILDKCKSFKVEYAPETVLARYYSKFESTLLDVLGIKYKELKQMQESEQFTKEIMEQKLNELVKDNLKYEKAVKKLANVMSDMEIALNGKGENPQLKDLITAIENNYNNTAKRLNGAGRFKNTVDRLVKEDVSTLAPSLKSKEELFDFLDGTLKPAQRGGIECVKENAKGVGSSKNQAISRIVERYQGADNSFRRILHLFDFYKSASPKNKYQKELVQMGKDALLSATSSDHTLKLNTVNNPEFYKDVFRTVWGDDAGKSIKSSLEAQNTLEKGKLFERYKKYIKRFRDIIGNNNIDFTKPEHVVAPDAVKNYTKSARTRMAKFNLVAQTSVDMVKNAAARRYGNQKWLRLASAIGGTVLGATLLAQLGFGRIKNPHNILRKVNNDK